TYTLRIQQEPASQKLRMARFIFDSTSWQEVYEQRKCLVETCPADWAGDHDGRGCPLEWNRTLKLCYRTKLLCRLRKHRRTKSGNRSIPMEDVGGGQCQ